MNCIIRFLEKEKQRKHIVIIENPNGSKYVIKDDPLKTRVVHSCFKPLDDTQINKLQSDVGLAKRATFLFPEWYREFLKTTNGLNVFGAISLHGEQTPMVEHPQYGQIEALIERDNPEWMVPYNLRYVGNTIFDASVSRWLMIGSYYSDGTNIVWDYKANKIVAMYALPVAISIKALKKMKEADYEQLIFAEWDSFERFFLSETERLSAIFDKYEDLTVISNIDIQFWKRTLPIGHKDFVS